MTNSRLTRKEEVQDTSHFCSGCGKEFLEGEEKKQIKPSINGWPEIWIHAEDKIIDGFNIKILNPICFSDWFGE